MIALRKDILVAKTVLAALEKFQAEIDSLPTFGERSARAKELFSRKNTKKNRVFAEVKRLISELCNSTRRCVYCEDSLADEVEHIYPKDLFPGKCFSWENYVYACGPCNGPKNNKFALFCDLDGCFLEVNPKSGQPAAEPPPGSSVFLNPRVEDPMDYCMLDLSSTFVFKPLVGIRKRNRERVIYTYDVVLRLNSEEREELREARKQAYDSYKARLYYYIQIKDAAPKSSKLKKMIEGIKGYNHPSVWKEMQRYHRLGKLQGIDPELERMFTQAPEALDW